MSEPCTLVIRAPGLRVHLEGDPDFVRRGYARLRDDLLARLGPTLGAEPDRDPAEDVPTVVGRTEPGPEYVWVFRCNDLYNKVHVIKRSNLWTTGLGRVVDIQRIKHVYVERAHADALAELVPIGKTLWSELTRVGRERLRT